MAQRGSIPSQWIITIAHLQVFCIKFVELVVQSLTMDAGRLDPTCFYNKVASF